MLTEYIEKTAANTVKPPYAVNFTKEPIAVTNARAITVNADLQRLLAGEGIPADAVGSFSTFTQIPRAFDNRAIHDVDFVVDAAHIPGVKRVLQRENFRFWDEKEIHRTVEHYTGGHGRHHNFGATHDQYREDEIPMWIGFFADRYSPGHTYSTENYSISKDKIKQLLKSVFAAAPDFHPDRKARLLTLSQQKLTFDSFAEIIDVLGAEGVNFWKNIDNNDVNEAEMAIREAQRPKYKGEFMNVEMVKDYPLPKDDFGVLDHEGTRVRDMEYALTLMLWHFPHYLGSRAKYVQRAQMITGSSLVNAERLNRTKNIHDSKKTTFTPTGVYAFSTDLSFDAETLRRLTASRYGTADLNAVDYRAVLLEGVHYKKA